MPRKKQSREEILQKAKIARRLRYAKIKADHVLYALEKEKERQRYIKRKEQKKILSIQEMTPRAARQQRKKWRENFKKHYRRKLLQGKGLELMDANTPSGSDDENPVGDGEDPLETHQENVPSHSNSTNSISAKTLVQSHCVMIPNSQNNTLLEETKKKLHHLKYLSLKNEKMYKSQIECLKKKVVCLQKVIQRLKKRLESPNTKAIKLLEDKSKINEAKKKILFGEAMKNSLEASYMELQSNKDKKTFSDIVLKHESVLRKHKVLSETKKFTVRYKKEAKNQDHYEKLKADIVNFFERDDVSRMTAGKKESITRNKLKKQKRYLLDTLKNLHKSFEQEFCKISYSYFCKHRPFWVLIPDVNDRETCLCKMHANIDLLIQVLSKKKIIKEKDYKDVVNSLCCPKPECLIKRCDACSFKNLEYVLDDENDKEVVFYKWENKTEKYISKGVEKRKRIITKTKKTMAPKEAVEELEKSIPIFLNHEGTRRWQFSAIKNLKSNLKANEAIIHIDFSENYTFKYGSEVQAFHFGGSREELTLHTVVLYCVSNTAESIICKSFCSISKNMRHDAVAVWAHIVPLLEYIQAFDNNINTVHFISDSPSSQYRNKTMFYIISKFYWHFPTLQLITWNYSEAGHGKGAADGVGGTVKRIADAAVAQGRDIANIDSFIQCVRQSAENIEIFIVEDYQIFEKDLLIPNDQLQILKGTLKVHQILWLRKRDDLIFRELSCFQCLDTVCTHTKFVGTLSYAEKAKNYDTHIMPYRVQPNNFLIRKPQKKTLRANLSSQFADKENVQITFNIPSPLPLKTKEKLTRLSDLTPDNKMHLESGDNINDMLKIYNISTTSSANFSGIFENFALTQSPQSDLNKIEFREISDSDSDDLEIFPKRPKH